MKKFQFFMHVPNLGTKLFRKISFITALLLSVNFLLSTLQAQTFNAVPLDGGGWTSGFAQANNGRIYAYGDVFGAWRSDNGGTNWSYLNWDIPDGAIVGYGMAVQKDNADVVYYYSYAAIYKSTNGGTTWTNILSPLGDNNPRFRGTSPIMIRANNPNEIWFAGPRQGLTGWLWRSNDGGTTWAKAGGSTFDSNQARTLHNVSQYPNQIWVGASDGLYVSTNGGSTFTRISDLSDVGMIQRFTSGGNAGIGLVTRSNINSGGISRITATDFNNAATYTVTHSSAVNLHFGYPTGLQIFSDGTASAWNTSADRHGFSNDGGLTFVVRATTLNTNPVPVWTTAATMAAKNHPDYGTDQVIEDVTNPNKWIITGGGAAMYSLDKGFSWQYFPNGSGIAAVKTYLAGVSRHDANRIYIPASDIGSAIVTDGGASGQASRSSCKFYDQLHSSFRIMEGPDANNLVLAGVKQSVGANLLLKSSDGGVTWAESSLGNLPASSDGIVKSVMSLNNANDFLVVLSEVGSPAQRVYRTTNGGGSFSGVTGLPDNLSTGGRYGPQNSFIERDATNNNVRYFVARGQNFFKSTDGGSNWSASTNPFGTAWVWGLHADPIRTNNLWAAGDWAGVKVSRDGGQTWTATAQYFDARYVSSCDGKIAVWGRAGGQPNPFLLWYSNDDGATWTAQTSDANNFHGVQGITVDRNGKIWVSWNSCTVVTPVASGTTVAVTGVSLNPTSVSVVAGANTTITATVAPSNATDKSITWGSSNNSIATVSTSGVVTGVAAGSATITVTTVSGGKTATCAVTVTAASAISGNVTAEFWTGITGTTIPAIPATAANTTSTLTLVEIPVNAMDNYLVRIRGYIVPSTTGSYNLYIASDDNGQLWLSTNNLPANKTQIASVSDWTNSKEWTKYTTQKSAAKNFTAGTKYYFEAIMKEGAGGDNLAIGWTGPGISAVTVIGSANLDKYDAGANVAVTGVTMSPTTASVAVGGTTTLTATINPSNATNKSVSWTSSNTAIATVSSSGVVTGVAAGSSTITVTTADGAKTATCAVTVTSTIVAVTSVSISPTTASVAVGATTTLTATVNPSNATNKSVSWTSSNTAIATVSSSGVVTGVAAGSSTITLTTADGAKTATCVVTVSAPSGNKYEAENATRLGDAVVVSANSGYSGTGYVNGLADNGSGVSFAVNVASAASYSITVHYCQANGPGYQGSLYANGSRVASVLFGSLASWTTWADVWQNVSLNAGNNNIVIQKDPGDNSGGSGINIDFISIGAVKSAKVTAISSNLEQGVMIYPNPVSNMLHITNAAQNADISVFSIDGKLVTHLKANGIDQQIDVKGWNKGMYILSILSNNQNMVTKLIVR